MKIMSLNAQVAEVFTQIADYMEVAGENSFKIRAYRRAAEAVATHSAPIEAAAEAGTLRDIEGLGEATAAKTLEFLQTGKVQYLERLKEEYPPGLMELLRVPGLGPKKVAALYEERKIENREGFAAALEAGTLRGLSGFGPKTLENLKRSLERMDKLTTRLPISAALAAAEKLQTQIEAAPEIERVFITGSLRRGCDTVGDINLLAQGTIPGEAVLPSLPGVLETLESENGVRVRIHPGIEVGLQTAPASQIGAALFWTTGNVAHREEAVRRAEKLGYELRRDGLFSHEAVLLQTQTEEEIYAALNVPFIAPELREGRDEWRAADADELPRLIETADIRGDLHSHSTWSDGAVSIRQMAQAMLARGYEYFAVTDHSKALAMANGLNAARLREQAREIEEVQADFPDLKILRGVECDIMRDGSLDLDDDILHELDIVIASVHSAFTLDEATQTARMIRAISHPAVDIIAHPTGRILGVRAPYDVNVNALIAAAKETRTTLEINASERLDLNDEHAFAAREAGVLLAVDTDAHSTRMLANIELGLLTARRAWCEAGDVLNAKPAAELMAWLERSESR